MSDFVGFHHAIIGLVLMLIGFIILISGRKTKTRKRIALVIIALGALIFADDVFQHYMQYTDPSYRSPLHKLYGATFWKWHWIQKINEWFDKVFGRKV